MAESMTLFHYYNSILAWGSSTTCWFSCFEVGDLNFLNGVQWLIEFIFKYVKYWLKKIDVLKQVKYFFNFRFCDTGC